MIFERFSFLPYLEYLTSNPLEKRFCRGFASDKISAPNCPGNPEARRKVMSDASWLSQTGDFLRNGKPHSLIV